MVGIKVLHTADNHLDPTARFLGPKELDRRRDFLKAFNTVIKYAMDYKPDIVLVSGDLYDKVNPRNPVRMHVIRAFRRLSSEGIKIFMVGGNHETPRSVEEGASPIHEIEAAGYATFFSSVKEVSSHHIKVKGLDVCVSGASFDHTMSEDADPLSVLRIPVEGDVNIALLHYNLDSFAIPDLWKAPTIRETSVPRDLHYLALGHLHRHQYKRIGRTLAVYPGSTERRSFIEERDPSKGFVWLEVNEDGVQSLRLVEIPSRPMKTVKVFLDESDRDPVKKVVRAALTARNPDLILRLRVVGRLPLNALSRYNRSEVIKKLGGEFFHVVVDDRGLEYLCEEVEFEVETEFSPKNAFKMYVESLIEKSKNPEEREVLKRTLSYGLGMLDEVGAW